MCLFGVNDLQPITATMTTFRAHRRSVNIDEVAAAVTMLRRARPYVPALRLSMPTADEVYNTKTHTRIRGFLNSLDTSWFGLRAEKQVV